jgi:hypothetical protein
MGPHLHLEVRRARADGRSPFPGSYRHYNVDPERWMAAVGVRFEHAPSAEHVDPEAPALTSREELAESGRPTRSSAS